MLPERGESCLILGYAGGQPIHGERYYSGEVLLEIEEKFKAIHDRHSAPQATVQIPVEVYA